MRSKVDILYKYRGDNEYTERLLTTNEVWLADPASLNDPPNAVRVSLMRRGKNAASSRWKTHTCLASLWVPVIVRASPIILSFCRAFESPVMIRGIRGSMFSLHVLDGHHGEKTSG